MLPPERTSDPLARGRFLREAQTVAQLSHPHIVPIFAVDEDTPFVFHAMAYVEGETLGERVLRDGPLHHDEASRLIREVAWALAYSHARGVIHRDVKPDNILIEATTGRALVTDFGIARVGNGSGSTGPHQVVGTAEFISPEQAAGRPADPRSDIYALGVVAFFALSGHLPFSDPDPRTVLVRHMTEPAPSLSSVADRVPRQLARVVERCLEKDPAARFASAEAVGQALARGGLPPVPVRAFLTECNHLAGPALGYWALVAAALPLGLDAVLTGGTDPLLAAAGGLGTVALPLLVLLRGVRRLVASGHAREDLIDALESDLARRSEELAYSGGGRSSRLERGFQIAAHSGALGLAVAVGSGRSTLAVVLGTVALASAVTARLMTERRSSAKLLQRLRFWQRWGGRVVFQLARLGAGRARGAAPSPLLSRTTTPA